MIHFNLGSHDGRMLEDLTALVESTERTAFTTNSGESNADSGRSLSASPTSGALSPETRCPASVPQLCSDPTRQTDDVCNAPVVIGKSFCVAHQELEEEYAD